VDLLIFGFKIVVLLFVVQFVRSRFGGGPIVTILVLVIGYIVLDKMWPIFGPMMFIYLFILFGFTALMFDLAMATPWRTMETGGEGGEQITSKEYSERMARERARKRRVFG
jgi:hypothetical protein